MKITRTMIAVAAATTGLAFAGWGSAAGRRPNVVVILADDMGYSDIGCYGSEIPTPNLDALAAQGMRFSQFYNYARCCPSRAALLTGLYPHQASMGWMTGTETEHPGYKAGMSTETPTIAEVMKGAGYATYMVGKWHVSASARVDGPKGNWPVGRGFERFYGTITGGGSFYDPAVLVRQEQAISPFTDEEYKPEGGRYYYTTALGAHAAKFVKEHKQRAGGAEKPFFMYVSFTAPHWPLHAPEEAVAKHKGKYDGGYEPVREARLRRQKELGVVPPDTALSPQAWEWDKVENRAWEARCMEVYAAQMELMDAAVGRVVTALKETGEFDDTVVMFLADNGASDENTGRIEPRPRQRDVPRISDVRPKTWPAFTRGGEPVRRGPGAMPGPETTYIAYGDGWANVSNTPFRGYKRSVHEGGIATPLVVSWPNGTNRRGEWERQYGSVVDLMATCVDLAGVKYPPKTEGVSLVPTLRGEQLERKQPIFWEHEGNRAVRDGKWKLVATGAEGAWELYDIAADRVETDNMAATEPGRVEEMAAAWQAWAERSQVLPLTPYRKKDK